jgi:hypothetical protein
VLPRAGAIFEALAFLDALFSSINCLAMEDASAQLFVQSDLLLLPESRRDSGCCLALGSNLLERNECGAIFIPSILILAPIVKPITRYPRLSRIRVFAKSRVSSRRCNIL